MPIADSLRLKLLDVGRRIIFARDWIYEGGRLLPGARASSCLGIAGTGCPVRCASGNRFVTGWLVAEIGPLTACVLLFHGIGDKSESWRGVQQRLALGGMRSLIFHYPGYGGNEAETTVANMEADARAAYGWLVADAPAGIPVFLLGFSLGSGLSAAVASRLRPVPAGLILAEAFSSLREAAKRAAWPVSPMGNLMPDVWRTCENVVGLKMPLLVIHSSGDRLFPVSMAEEIHEAAMNGGGYAELRVFAGYPHDAPYKQVPEDYWAAILDFIAGISDGARG